MASIHRRTVRWTTQDGHQRTGQRWQTRYVGEDRKEHAKLFALKKDAHSWLDQQTADLIRGDWTDPAAGTETLRTYATRWERIQVSAEVPRSFRIGRRVRYWHNEVTTWLQSQSDGPTAA
jgi:hypothetical protein